jgi:hypothetical protein
MDQSVAEQLYTVLGDLATNVPDIKASAVVSVDGLIIASQLPVGIEEDRVGAVSAALLSLGERSSQEMACGDLSLILLKSASGYIVTMSVGANAVLSIMSSENAALGRVFLELEHAAERLAQILLKKTHPSK